MSNRLYGARLIRAALLSFAFHALATAQDQTNVTSASQTQSSAHPASTPADPDPGWHTDFTFYLWFPGVHGITGVNGFNVGYKASPADLLSHFRFGLMGAVDLQRDRFIILTDAMWVRLEGNRTVSTPFPNLPQFTTEAKANQFILTPKFGYRAFDGEKIKIDAFLGVRYWYLGSSLQFTPSLRGATFSGSRNWADPLMGGRIQIPLSSKVLVTILGDAGGWGAGAQLDYQIVGILGLKLSPKWTLSGGYRYLYVEYRPGSFLYQTAMSGAALGVTYSFK